MTERSPAVLCSHNEHKVGELRQLLSLPLTSLSGQFELPEETGDTFEANARIKATAGHAWFPDRWVIADDSGLEVDALNGAPGVYSARFAGPDATDVDNNTLLIQHLEGRTDRGARFVCVLVAIAPDGTEHVERGTVEGTIASTPSGDNGFGYDPLFIPNGFAQSFGVLPPDVKQSMSHRANAATKLRVALS